MPSSIVHVDISTTLPPTPAIRIGFTTDHHVQAPCFLPGPTLAFRRCVGNVVSFYRPTVTESEDGVTYQMLFVPPENFSGRMLDIGEVEIGWLCESAFVPLSASGVFHAS